MKTTKIILLATGALLFGAALNATTYTRQYNDPDNTLWTNDANWDIGSAPLAAGGDWIRFDAGKGGAGKTTLLEGGAGFTSLDILRLWLDEGTLIVSGIAVNHTDTYFQLGSNRTNLSGSYKSDLVLENGASFTAKNTYIGDSNGAISTLTIRDSATFTTSGGTLYVAAKAGTTGILNVEKGGTLNANRLHSGSDSDDSVGADATIDIRGNFTVSGILALSDEAGMNTAFNVYGSGNVLLGGARYIKDGATVTFHMQDISMDKVAKEGDALPTSFFWARTSSSLTQDDGDWVVDFTGLYIDGTGFDVGSTYFVGLISESKNMKDSFTFLLDGSAVSEGDQVGSNWIFEGLTNNGNDVFVQLTYVPEPGTYAAMFGLLAFGFVAYRKRQSRK